MCSDDDPIPPEYRPQYPWPSQATPPPQTMISIPQRPTAPFHSHPPPPYYSTNYLQAPVAAPLYWSSYATSSHPQIPSSNRLSQGAQHPNILEGNVLSDISTQYDYNTTCVFVKNLPHDVDNETIKDVFKDIGSFTTSEHAQQALMKNRQVVLKGLAIEVQPYQERPKRGRSSGTGSGVAT
ncbi:hypothetical protein ASPVEDRAFT_70861 [Aspergillus versicolor CBS 583.65]|uniref:RRM domain-containing protein n=1 Tax=Aspergillus versicolor CBS 583.65 TaxID=1036611 RepID=A0A1L9PGS5_ASPVE|nr:uncharacterized protein ASPVEDRAFT_70861 [Aspergillus versicolor CBS 583.65]OJJ00656.1 hypothetical protein ASPVEDRAFT_70861 [Aspergillus versicolor CBS 583.65]